MKLFRIANTSSSWWVFEETLEAAYDFSMAHGKAHKLENLRCTGEIDCPDDFHKGFGYKKVQMHNMQSVVDMLHNAPIVETEADKHMKKYKGWGAGGVEQPYSPNHDWLD